MPKLARYLYYYNSKKYICVKRFEIFVFTGILYFLVKIKTRTDAAMVEVEVTGNFEQKLLKTFKLMNKV